MIGQTLTLEELVQGLRSPELEERVQGLSVEATGGAFRCSVCEAVPRPAGAPCPLCKRPMGDDGRPVGDGPAGLEGLIPARERGGEGSKERAEAAGPASLSGAGFFPAGQNFRPVGEALAGLVVAATAQFKSLHGLGDDAGPVTVHLFSDRGRG